MPTTLIVHDPINIALMSQHIIKRLFTAHRFTTFKRLYQHHPQLHPVVCDGIQWQYSSLNGKTSVIWDCIGKLHTIQPIFRRIVLHITLQCKPVRNRIDYITPEINYYDADIVCILRLYSCFNSRTSSVEGGTLILVRYSLQYAPITSDFNTYE